MLGEEALLLGADGRGQGGKRENWLRGRAPEDWKTLFPTSGV